MKRQIEITMPSPGGFHSSPSGDLEYEVARHEAIKKGIPKGYVLVGDSSDVETEHRTITEYYAIVTVKQLEWKGILSKDRTLWFGIAEEGMTAPWMGALGACFVKIWDIRRRDDGIVEYGIGNETRPSDDKMGWITADKFYSEWPQ